MPIQFQFKNDKITAIRQEVENNGRQFQSISGKKSKVDISVGCGDRYQTSMILFAQLD